MITNPAMIRTKVVTSGELPEFIALKIAHYIASVKTLPLRERRSKVLLTDYGLWVDPARFKLPKDFVP